MQRDPQLGGDSTAGHAAGERGREKSKKGARDGDGDRQSCHLSPGWPPRPPVGTGGGPGTRLPALCPAFLALFSFFSPPPPPRDALSNLSIYGQEVRSTGRLRGHPGRGTGGVTHLGDTATPRWGGQSGAGWGHLGMAPPPGPPPPLRGAMSRVTPGMLGVPGVSRQKSAPLGRAGPLHPFYLI